MNATLLAKLKELKAKYQPEGFEIVGLFGSFARNEETESSNVDIAYQMAEAFLARFRGFNAFARHSNAIPGTGYSGFSASKPVPKGLFEEKIMKWAKQLPSANVTNVLANRKS